MKKPSELEHGEHISFKQPGSDLSISFLNENGTIELAIHGPDDARGERPTQMWFKSKGDTECLPVATADAIFRNLSQHALTGN